MPKEVPSIPAIFWRFQPMARFLRFLPLICLFGLVNAQSPTPNAQSPAPQTKKFVTPDDAKSWEMLVGARISNDGRWFAYGVGLVDGDGRLMLRSCDGPEKWVTPIGANAQFSDDSKWVAYTIGLPKAEMDKLRDQKKQPETKMGLRNLGTGEEQ